MKTNISGGRKLRFSVDLDENDKEQALQVAQMMETPGWQILQKHVAVVRDQLIDRGKDQIILRGQRELAPYLWAQIDGFDVCATIARAIVTEAAESNTRGHEGDGLGGDVE